MSKKFILNPAFPRVMRKIVRAMRSFEWCLIGGRAVEAWTNPPQTPDIDLLAHVSDEDARKMVAGFAREKITLEDENLGLGSPILFFLDRAERVEVDVLGAFEDMHHWVMERAVARSFGGVKFRVAQAEDVVILKARAATERVDPAKGQRDIQAILTLAQEAGLNSDYLCEALVQAGWEDELRLLRELKVCE